MVLKVHVFGERADGASLRYYPPDVNVITGENHEYPVVLD
jgi:hypothetical protein